MTKIFYPSRISDLMRERDISKREFCNKLKISYGTYINWVKVPSTIKVDDLINICEIFNKDVSYFIYDPDNKNEAVDNESKDANVLLVNMAKDVISKVVKYEREIGQLMLEHQKALATKDLEIQRLKFVLTSTASSAHLE